MVTLSSSSSSPPPAAEPRKPGSIYHASDRSDSSSAADRAMLSPQNAMLRRRQDAWRFVTVDHPEKFKDPAQQRAKRQHVMKDYLVKERQKPSSTDSRARKTPRSQRHRRTTTPAAQSVPRAQIWRVLVPSERQTAVSLPSRSVGGSSSSYASSIGSDVTTETARDTAVSQDHLPSPVSQVNGEQRQLIPGSAGRHKNARFHAALLHQLKFPNTRLGSALNPFDVWPGFEDKALDIAYLKLRCNSCLGSTQLGEQWVPQLIKARHSFVSTVCISTAHDDILTRAVRTPYVRFSREWHERMRVHYEVVGMIQEALADPEQANSDTTIIAVIHLLTAEVMGCDDRIMNMHHRALQQLVRSRGGLASFGNNFAMSVALSTTLYMIAVLRERMPPRDYVVWSERQQSTPPTDGRPLPESPLYFPKSGFMTLSQSIPDGLETLPLLEDLRELTATFLLATETNHSSRAEIFSLRIEQDDEIARLSNKILSYGHHKLYNFSRSSERYTYEAIRLTAQIYAYALSNRVPFSRAAQHMPRAVTLAPGESERLPLPMPTQIKHALIRSDLTEAWGQLSGVLLWVALVAGAAANPYRDEFYFARRDTADEETRKFHCAVAMRVSILHTFEHSLPLVETLKRMISIQQTIEALEDDADPQVSAQNTASGSGAGFSDYANEFLSL